MAVDSSLLAASSSLHSTGAIRMGSSPIVVNIFLRFYALFGALLFC